MVKVQSFRPVIFAMVLLFVVPVMFMFAGCDNTANSLSANRAMTATVTMWEQVKTDIENAPTVSQGVSVSSLTTDANGLTLQNGLDVDNSGVGQLLCFDFLTASMYIAETLTLDGSGYTLGSVFSGDSVITQETAESYMSYQGMAGQHIAIKSGMLTLDDNVISGQIVIVSPFGLGNPGEFNFFAQFEATIDETTYAVTDFKIVFYDNDSQGAGENLWYFKGVTYNQMQGIYINVDTTEVQEEITFASTIKANATNLYGQTATVTDKDFSTEMNSAMVYGAGLTTALMNKE